MARPRERTYSRYTVEAVELLGRLIRKARLQKRISAKDLAARANVSRGLLQRVEKGDPRCEIGVAFELAALLGLPLFQSDLHDLQSHNQRQSDILALLPQPERGIKKAVHDDF